MSRDHSHKKSHALATLLYLSVLSPVVLVFAGFLSVASADDAISVTCYDEAKSSLSLGNVLVYDVAGAAQACNSVVYSCRGKCIGCYQDYDYVDSVCVDNLGNTFLK